MSLKQEQLSRLLQVVLGRHLVCLGEGKRQGSKECLVRLEQEQLSRFLQVVLRCHLVCLKEISRGCLVVAAGQVIDVLQPKPGPGSLQAHAKTACGSKCSMGTQAVHKQRKRHHTQTNTARHSDLPPSLAAFLRFLALPAASRLRASPSSSSSSSSSQSISCPISLFWIHRQMPPAPRLSSAGRVGWAWQGGSAGSVGKLGEAGWVRSQRCPSARYEEAMKGKAAGHHRGAEMQEHTAPNAGAAGAAGLTLLPAAALLLALLPLLLRRPVPLGRLALARCTARQCQAQA